VVVPYAGGYETEQTLRACLLAERGALEVVTEEELSAQSIAEAVERALATPAARLGQLDTSGAETTVRVLRETLAGRRAAR
jgi:predicted glycosyltransferase